MSDDRASSSDLSRDREDAAQVQRQNENHAELFPKLTDEQVDRLREYGAVRRIGAGEVLFQAGDRDIDFFVVLSGVLGVFVVSGTDEQMLGAYGPGDFTGEANVMLSGAPAIATGRMERDGDVIGIDHQAFRKLVAVEIGLQDALLPAFMLRRAQMIESARSNVVLIGASDSADTLRLRRFLGRNGHPFRYVDLAEDDEAQALINAFKIGVEEVPIVIFEGSEVLRNPSNEDLAATIGFAEISNDSAVRDVVVVGAGPAGLASAFAVSSALNSLCGRPAWGCSSSFRSPSSCANASGEHKMPTMNRNTKFRLFMMRFSLSSRPGRGKRYVEIPDRVSPGDDRAPNSIDNFLSTLYLIHITRPRPPVLKPDTEVAASLQRHSGQWGVHNAWLAD